jgi:hypothetical protein
VTIPDRINGLLVVGIGGYAFGWCTSVTNVSLPNSVTNIGEWAFYYCPNLAGITLPGNLKRIGDQAFAACRLSSVAIPSGAASIGSAAFYGCISLTNITIPGSTTSMGEAPFRACAGLVAIVVDPDNPNYSSVDGVLFNKNRTTLIQYAGGNGERSYTIPSSVTNIADDAFCQCTSLTNITMPNGLTRIGAEAFWACFGLTSVTIPRSVTNIGDCAFTWCTSLTAVYFQGNAPMLGSSVFADPYDVSVVDNAIVYRLPAATGWPPVPDLWGGRPTALWPPYVQSGGYGFGVQMNQFGFDVNYVSGVVVVVDACTNLVNPCWIPLQTNTLIGDSFHFSDPNWTNHPARFYRIRSPW